MDKDGGAAFPRAARTFPSAHNEQQDGMSLRDYFAAAALTGIIAANEHIDSHTNKHPKRAYDALAYADAMLAARAGETK